MLQDSPASSFGSYGRWRWIQQNYVSHDSLRLTRNGVDYVLVSKVSNSNTEEEISEETKRYAVHCSVYALLFISIYNSILLLYLIPSEFQVFNFLRDRKNKRDVFLTNLKAEGLTIARRLKPLENGMIVQFDLITAGDKMLQTYAEILQLRMPLKKDEKVENMEMMQPKHGFHILAWIHHIMKKHFPEFMKKVTPSLPTLKVF